MMGWFRRGLAFLALSLGGTISPGYADPALWMTKSTTATIYVFGTIHVLKAETKWRYPKLDAAFKSAKEVYFEVDEDINDGRLVWATYLDLGVDLYHPLSTLLTKKEWAELDAAARSTELVHGADDLDQFRPWVAAFAVGGPAFKKEGYDAKKGVEPVLYAEAKAAGKPIKGMEGFGYHFHYLADLPHAVELAWLRQTLREAQDATAKTDALVEAWSKGDVDAIAASDEEMKTNSPEVYDALLVQRNRHWADKIVNLLKTDKTIFIAVGSGHLAGPDSVQHNLEAKGVKIDRL
jgi:hypothetical protein